MCGQMAGPIKATGSTTRCMAGVLILGRMAESMKGSTSMTRNTGLARTLGRMEGSMWASGRIVKDMAGARLFQWMEVKDRVFGRMMLSWMTLRLKVVISSLRIVRYRDSNNSLTLYLSIFYNLMSCSCIL